MTDNKLHGFNTRAIHAGQHHDPETNAIITPIYATSTFAHTAPGVHKGFDYARFGNPTRLAFETAVAEAEGGKTGFAFASGMAAIAAILDMLQTGAHIIATDDLYGGTYRLMEQVRRRSAGLDITYVDLTDLEKLKAALRPTTKMILVETPTNPLLKLADITAISEIARERDLLVVVDNTFATPWIQRPLELGADIVVHSATKFINGHSDVIGGIAVVSRTDLAEQLGFLQAAIGAIPSPVDCFLMHRGLKTLGLRMERQNASAEHLAAWLEGHSKVERVLYSGLPSHPQYALAQKQMQGRGGAIITLVVRGGVESAKRVLTHTQLFILAKSLGGVESLISHPGLMTHTSIPADVRRKIGIEDGMIRLSVGIEDVSDLQADLEQALS